MLDDEADWWLSFFQTCPDAPEYVGLRLDEAQARSSERGVAVVREINADAPRALTADRRPSRLNLLVRDGVVVAAAWC